MANNSISQLPAAATLDGSELVEVSQLSSTVTITAATISAQASDNSYNDSGDGFVAAGFAVGQRVKVAGFTGDVANNIFSAVITALTTGKMTISGTDGDVIVDDAAGESVTITKWDSRRSTAADMGAGGGGGGGTAWQLTFRPFDNEPPASNFATLDLRNSRAVLDFDTTTQESAIFTSVLPNGYGGGGITVDIFFGATSATSGTIGWDVAIERIDTSSLDTDSDSFATAATVTAATVPGTSGQILKSSVNIADGTDMDSLAAGELFRIRIRRDVANDTATGDAELFAVSIREQ